MIHEKTIKKTFQMFSYLIDKLTNNFSNDVFGCYCNKMKIFHVNDNGPRL